MQVAKECDRDLACYGKKLNDPSWTRAEKAAFAIAFSGDAKQGVPLLLAAMKPITTMVPERYPVHQAILFALARLGTKDCKECVEKLDKQIERDEKAVRIPGARDLLGETRVTEAIIQNKGANDAIAADGNAGGRRSGPGPPPPRAARRPSRPSPPSGQGQEEEEVARSEAAQGGLPSPQPSPASGRGVRRYLRYSATIVVVMPPRMLKAPSTRARRGLTAATRSSRIRLVTASWNAPSSRYDQR